MQNNFVYQRNPKKAAALGLTLKGAVIGLTALVLATTGASATSLKAVPDGATVRIAVANDIPYGYMDISNRALDAGPDVARAVLKAMGVDSSKIEWIETKFSSLIPGLRANRFDMAAAEVAVRPERCRQVIYSEPNTSYGKGPLAPEANPNGVHGYADVIKGGLKVAVMAGADQLDMLSAMGVQDKDIITLADNSDAISTISTGRAGAFAATGLTVSELAKKSSKVELASGFIDPVIDGKPVRSWGALCLPKDLCAGI